ncbi:MAG: DNA repair protein RecO [Bdellovibrio sp.]|nr:MAG: DNA repair protein RecO [Bdellovibrio sp.]
MAELKTVQMIIMKTYKWSEADLIIHALMPTGAREHFLARAALKSRRRFGGGTLEPTHCIEAIFQPARTETGLHHLQEARVIESFEGLRGDYDRLLLALNTVAAVDRTAPGGEIPGLYSLLGNALKALATGRPTARVEAHFAIKFLRLHGVLASVDWMRSFLSLPLNTQSEESFPDLKEGDRKNLLSHFEQFVASAEL